MKYYTPVTRMSCNPTCVFVRETYDIDNGYRESPDNYQIIIPESSIEILSEHSDEFNRLMTILPLWYFYYNSTVFNQDDESKRNNLIYLIITNIVMDNIKSYNLEIELVTFKVSGQWHNNNMEKQGTPWLLVDENQQMYYRVPLIHGSLENIMLYKLSR